MKWDKLVSIVAALICISEVAHGSAMETVAQLSDVWASGHYLSPDIACDPRRWDAAFGEASVHIIEGRRTLDQAKAMLMATSDAYVKHTAQQPFGGQSSRGAPTSNRLTIVSPELAIVRIAGSLSTDERRQLAALHGTATLVFDLRSAAGQGILDLAARSAVFENAEALQILGFDAHKLPPIESVIYQGYPSEWGFSSGYFRSSLVTSISDQEIDIASLDGRHLTRLIVIGNRNTALPRAILSARLRGQVEFISTDEKLAYGGLPSTESNVANSDPAVMLARYRGVSLQQALVPDATINERCVEDDRCIADFIGYHHATLTHPTALAASCDALPARDEVLASSDSYPGLASRLYAVTKLYHVLRLFYPAQDLLGDIRARYVSALQGVTIAANAHDYVMVIARFLAPIRDGHIEIIGMSYFEAFGLGDLPISTFFYEGNVYVGCDAKGAPGLRRGDRVVAVDGKDVHAILAEIGEVKTAAIGRERFADSARYVFRGLVGSSIKIDVVGQDGVARRIDLTRSQRGAHRCTLPWTPDRNVDVKWLSPDIAYLNLSVATGERIDQLAPELSRARSLIVDNRGGANGGAWSLAAHLSSEPHLRVARFVTQIVSGRDAVSDEYHDAISTLSWFQEIHAGAIPRIGAQVFVLIDDNTSSQAEHSLLLLRAATHTKTIGLRTAGTLGDATAMILPGNLPIRFTGDLVEDLDGRRILGHGITPDLHVSPTLDDLLHNRDPMLEVARAAAK